MGSTQELSSELGIGFMPNPTRWPYWSRVREMLTPAQEQSDESWEKIEADLAADTRQLWIVLDDGVTIAAAITGIVQSRHGEVAEVYLVGGTGFRRWIAALSNTIEAAARDAGCIGMRAYGRFGWKPSLTELGWTPFSMSYRKDF